ncbi:MAG: PstC family ABC transporter permease, partial [Acutalibacteraceae bacterium]
PRVAKIIHPAIELLAGIPSVVYGFFGMLVIVPAIRAMFPGKTIGDSLLAAIIILAIMVIPTIVNVTENALRAVPKSYREASLGLGATPIRTIFKVTIQQQGQVFVRCYSRRGQSNWRNYGCDYGCR